MIWLGFKSYGADVIQAWMTNHIPSIVWGEITYLFPNFNGSLDEVWEWISDFTPLMLITVITHPWWG